MNLCLIGRKKWEKEINLARVVFILNVFYAG